MGGMVLATSKRTFLGVGWWVGFSDKLDGALSVHSRILEELNVTVSCYYIYSETEKSFAILHGFVPPL